MLIQMRENKLLRDAGGGGPGGHFGYQLTLFGPRGADYARHITTGPPPIFLDDAASLLYVHGVIPMEV